MAGDYGVLVANKFVLLDDDGGDPLEALQKAEVKAKKEEKPKGQVSSDKNKKVTKPTASAPEKKSDKPQGSAVKREVERPPRLQNRPPSSQGGQQRPEGERRVPRVPREGGFSGPREGFSGPRDDATPSGEFGNRGGYRGRGRGGRGGGFGRDRAPGEADQYRKREFERHSGSDKTGVKPVVKREGGGAHNWGQSVDPQWQKDAEAAPAELDESADAGHATTGDAATEEAGGDVSAEVAAVEEGANEMTLDEWKAANEKNRAKAAFNVRKPNEGHEDPKWKKMFVLKKAEDEEEEEEEEEEEVEEDHVSKKNVVNIEITFGDADRRGGYGGRGGRGRGGRGGRGRGGDRYPSGAGGQQAGVPHVDDQAEFPSLGSH